MIPYTQGNVPKQAHVGIPEGLCEEEFGRKGFFGRYAHLYRSEAPVAWNRIEGDLKPQAFDLNKWPQDKKKFPLERFSVLYNSDVNIQFSYLDKDPEYYFRNADCDEVVFVHHGQGNFYCDFGKLEYNCGDYLVIPRGTVYKFVPNKPSNFLIIESASEITLPDKGMLGQHALFDPAVLEIPQLDYPETPKKTDEYKLTIKHRNKYTNVYYPHCPLNTIAWKGTLTVWKLNVADIRPVSSDRYHLPPSAHTTFLGNNFVICSFLPRPLENGDPTTLKVPFYHSNIDYDEVLFYHSGDFFSRSGIKQGMLTFHPQGIHHGPHKNAIERSKTLERTDEVAIMIDTRYPLTKSQDTQQIEITNYWESWK
jgi:homogentisate 1,2-dioxygenase